MKDMKSRKRIALLLAVVTVIGAAAGCAGGAKRSAAAYVTADYEESGAYYEALAEYALSSAVPMADTGSGSAGLSGRAAANNGSAEQTAADPGSGYERKVVYNAALSLTADDPRKVLDTVSARCRALGGYLSGSYERSYANGTIYVTATVKVPADGLNDLLAELRTLGKVDSSRLSSDDISQSYYDVEARLRAAKAEEEQLIRLLEKCVSVKDMLSVREQLACVRSDIESYQAQINLWDHQVAYATIELTINETPKTPAQTEDDTVRLWKFSDVARKMKTGFGNSWRFLVNALGALGIFIANALLPVAVLGAAAFGIVRLVKAIRNKNKGRREARRQARLEKKAEKNKPKE